MADVRQIETRIEHLAAPGFRGKLLARGLARELIWRKGKLPPESPKFSFGLSADLLDYGFTLLRLGLELRAQSGSASTSELAFSTAAEAIESTVKNGKSDEESRGFTRVMASAAYHLAHYSARAFCLLGEDLDGLNLNFAERAAARLMRRDLRTLDNEAWEFLESEVVRDNHLADALTRGGISEEQALQTILNFSVVRAVSMFLDSLQIGTEEGLEAALVVLRETTGLAADAGFVTLWWLSYVLQHLMDDLWAHSMHSRIPVGNGNGAASWDELRRHFIGVLWARDIAEVELWPSQLEAAKRIQNTSDDLIAALPTGAGKTRIAELAILRTLADRQRIVYVTPLRSLSAQLERSLRRTFQPLGFSVSSLYGASGSTHFDLDSLKSRNIVVATPEKLDFALRNDSGLINDVGLIVLDEGHTIGAGEREVRYEVLVQRLLRRDDAAQRRIVCLSAILPEGEKLEDFVGWLRSDEPGEALTNKWRPSRQRFGTIVQRSDHARLDLTVDTEKPFVEVFLAQVEPSGASRRAKPFPNDANELVLASAWKLARENQGVLIFCPLRISVESLARKCLKLHRQDLLASLLEENADIGEAVDVGNEWLGADHPVVQALHLGVAVHHAKLPRQFLHAIEELLAKRVLKVVIASPTLAQGLNLSASTVIMHSIFRAQAVITGEEFANVAGRAGRAFVDIDGQILYPIFENDRGRLSYKLKAWDSLVVASKNRDLTSGLFLLVKELLVRLVVHTGTENANKLTEYLLNNADWENAITPVSDGAEEVKKYNRDMGSLDSALLSLIEDLDCAEEEIPKMLDTALKHSLWSRQLVRLKAGTQEVCLAVLKSRAEHVWRKTAPRQRKGYYFAGIGVQTGLGLDEHLDTLVSLLTNAEAALKTGDEEELGEAVEAAARVVYQIEPFVPGPFPIGWERVLRGWLGGTDASDLEAQTPQANEFIQDGICYKLTWALEAIRVRSVAEYGVSPLDGSLVPALEVGACGTQEILLLRSGLRSRAAARKVVEELAAPFDSHRKMMKWIQTSPVQHTLQISGWPSSDTVVEWRRFARSCSGSDQRVWSEQSDRYLVRWIGARHQSVGERVRLRTTKSGQIAVYSLDLVNLGQLDDPRLFRAASGPGVCVIGPASDQVTLTHFSP